MKRRLLVALATLFAAMTFTFVLLHQMPGDVIHTLAQQLQTTRGLSYEEARVLAKAQLNYDPDQPVLRQYWNYLVQLGHGNLGSSLTFRIPVVTIVASALPWTLFITALATLVSFTSGTVMGLWAAWRRGRWVDELLTFYATLMQAVPDFLVGVVLLAIFGVQLQWLPLRGAYGLDGEANLLGILQHAVLPVLAFALPAAASWALTARASAIGVLGEEYLQVARAKGLKEKRILLKYLGRNAVLPLLPGLASTLGSLVGGSMLIETLFGYPGLGYFLAQAIGTRDYPLMQGLFLLTTTAMVFGNLAAEWLSRRLDPRLAR